MNYLTGFFNKWWGATSSEEEDADFVWVESEIETHIEKLWQDIHADGASVVSSEKVTEFKDFLNWAVSAKFSDTKVF